MVAKGAGSLIYFDNAATTLIKPDSVITAVSDAMRHFGNSGRGAHEAALDASRILYETRAMLCDLFHAEDAAQVAFTSNSTESLNTAILGLFSPGDHVITTVLEHNSVLRPLYLLQKQGVEVTFIPCDGLGNICVDAFRNSLQKNTKAVVCTHASNLTGNITPIHEIGAFCSQNELLFVVDASQSAGVLPINMEEMHIDVLCFTGHKGLMGPQGTGGICVKKGVAIRPLKVGGSGVHTYSKEHPQDMPTALEAGTLNSHGIAGLHAALMYIKEIGIETIHNREMQLMRRFYDGVSGIDGIAVYGDFSKKDRAAIVALNIGQYDSGRVSDQLFVDYQISTRPGAHCAPLLHQSFQTVEQGMVRFSFSYFNTEEEINIGIAAVRELAQ